MASKLCECQKLDDANLQTLDCLLLSNANVLLLQWNGAEAVVEVEKSLGRVDTKERCDVFVVGQCSTQADETHVILG